MHLPVQAQSNPKLSYFEHARNFSDIFQSINNITMVVIGIYTLTQIISHHYVVTIHDNTFSNINIVYLHRFSSMFYNP
jgi:cystathionine beta-lyase/cystathionine gamma-synthase